MLKMKTINRILPVLIFWTFAFQSVLAQSISVTYPNGGELFQLGRTVTIQWSSSSVSYVDLEYSTDNGVSWHSIETGVAASLLEYDWLIDSTTVNPTTEGLIRITNSSNTSQYDVSDNVFTLSKLQINSPNASSFLQKNVATNITWEASADIASISLEYSIDGGANWNFLAGGLDANAGSYTWDTDITPSDQVRLRISSEQHSQIYFDTPDFTVSELALTSPIGGESWLAGSTQTITWNSSYIPYVDIQYQVDGGSWQNIVSSYDAGVGRYSWTVPDVLSDQVYIRIRSSSNTSIYDVNSSQFSILNLQLTSPNGGEGFEIGSDQTITWTSNITGNITLELSTDGGATYGTEIASGIDVTTGSYDYTVENYPTNQAVIKITSESNTSIYDESDADFIIGTVSLTSPTGGESWLAGSYHTISWTNTNGIENIDIDYTTDDGTTWNTIVSAYPASSGSYNWYIPTTVSGDNVKFRIYEHNSGLGQDNVSNPITIASLQVTSPENGYIYTNGETATITWSASSNISTVMIEYSSDGGTSFNTIATGVDASLGTYSWVIPGGIASSQMQIRITSENNTNFYNTNQGFFIVASLQLVTPNGGEIIASGINYNVSWTASSNVGTIVLRYSSDNGSTWNYITSVAASTGSYSWTVPNITTTQALVRASYSVTNTLSDTSDATFTIGELRVVAPNGNEGFIPGNTTQIQWSATSFSYIDIEYSLDNGNNWNLIASDVDASLGTYSWTIPNSYTDNGLIRISESTNSDNYDLSDNTFRIGSIALTSPNGGEVYQTTTAYNITYSFSNNITHVNIDVSLDGGTSWSSVASNITANGTYSWTPGNIPSSNALIRITDTDYPDISDESDATFEIERLQLTSPNGGEFYLVDGTETITWNSAEVENVTLEYSTDDGTTWNTIISSTPGSAQSYDWTIPNTYTQNALVRIIDADNPSSFVGDTSDANFEINILYITTPDGGEAYEVNDNTNITWVSNNNTESVNIQYSTNNGSTWSDVATGVAVSDLQYAWTVPNTPTNEALVRILDNTGSDVYDISNSTFSIGTISVTSPNGGEKWQVDSVKYIRWNNISSVSNVNIDYSTDGGANWTSIATNVTASTGQYAWTVPNTVTGNALVKITDASNSSVYDVSNSTFTIADIEITYPNGGEILQAGANLSIQWTAYNLGTITIQYSTDNGTSWNTISSSVSAGTGSYNYTIPDDQNIATTGFLIKIFDNDFPTLHDISDAAATVEYLNLTSPDGGESWLAGSSKNITWNSSLVSNVDLYYSLDGGSTWNSIATGVTASAQSQNWDIDATISSDDALVKIVDNANTNIYDISSNVFRIGKVQITSPVSGDIWQAGTEETLTWTNSSNVTSINIEFSSDGGTSWQTLESSYNASLQTYTLTVPSVASSNAMFRITDAVSNSEITDNSDEFTILNLTVTSPQSTSLWQNGNSYDITWNSSNVANIKIEYSLDAGVSWNTIVSSTGASTGTYSWAVPNGLYSDSAQIKITDLDNGFYDFSDYFTIGDITVTQPTSSSVLQSGENYTIKWEASESISTVDIDYSTNSGLQWTTIASNVTASDSSYVWSVPSNTDENNVLVRVYHSSSDFGNNNYISAQAGPFKIVSLALTSPTSTAVWEANSSHDITWNAGSSLNTISIYFSSDNGSNWTNVVSGVDASLGSYSWTLPNDTTQYALIKIISDDYSNVTDSTSSAFKISKIYIENITSSTEWQSGKNNEIIWVAPYLTAVNIQYSLDNGISWTDIISGISASAGSYIWTTPANVSSNQAMIRITSENYPNISSESSAFTIKKLIVTSPNGGESWQSGENVAVTWNSDLVNNVSLSISSDNGSSWIFIDSSISASSSTYYWTVPDTLVTQNALVRLIDLDNSEIRDSSDAVFSISKLIVTNPSGGEHLQATKSYDITWTAGSSTESIQIEYSLDNGSTWILIVTGVNAALGTYNWTIPDTSSAQAQIRISDLNNGIEATSSVFTIEKLNLTTPSGNEYCVSGTSNAIKWNSENVGNVKIEFSSDNGSSWETLLSSVAASADSFIWAIPANYSTNQGIIRISDVDYPSIYSQNDIPFTLGNISIIQPNGGEVLQAGSSYSIQWTKTQSVEFVNLYYSSDNGANWNLLISNSDTTVYNWSIPDSLTTSSGLVKITSSASEDEIYDKSDNNFTIVKLKLLSPNGGETFSPGDNFTIRWLSGDNITNVKLDYYTPTSGWTNIVSSVSASAEEYSWTIPSVYSDSLKLRVVDVSNSNNADESDGYFRIASVAIINPLTTTRWQTGDVETINWSNSSNVAKINLYYKIGTNTRIPIAEQLNANLTQYNWTIPAISSDSVILIAEDAYAPQVIYDTTDFNISIADISITRPDSTLSWIAGSQQAITWNNSSSIRKVKIMYSADNELTWNTISDSTDANQGSFDWSIPTTLYSDNVVIAVSDIDYPNVDDTVRGLEISSASLQLVYPSGGEYWESGNTYPISWNNTNNISSVDIYYSTNSGNNWTEIISGYPADSSLYNFTVPANITTDSLRIKVSATAAPMLKDSSRNNTYVRKILILSPIAYDRFNVSKPKIIKWAASENVANVIIEFLPAPGESWLPIATVTASDSQYVWNVNNLPGDSVLIRISDAESNFAIADSSSYFSIGLLKLTSPLLGGVYKSGDTVSITYDNSSNITAVQFEYSADGNTWQQINSSPYSTTNQTYNWYLNQTICSDSVYIRVSDNLYSSLRDTIPVSITVEQLQIAFPIGGETWQALTTHNIEWTSCGIDSLSIEYSTDKGSTWATIVSSVEASAQSYAWTIPYVTSDSVLIKISDKSNTNINSISDYFAISRAEVTVIYPNGNETFQSGKTYTISWSSYLVNSVDIDYSLDNGATWNSIVRSYPDSLKNYSWQVPQNIHSSQCLIRIFNSDNSVIADASNDNFSIVDLQLTAPTQNELLQAGRVYNITWTASTEITNVKLSYSLDGNNWTAISGASNLAATLGQYSWSIPDLLNSNNAYVKIQYVAQDSIQATSDAFKLSWISLSQPTGGEVYTAEANVPVTWTNGDVIKTVKIDLVEGINSNILASVTDSASSLFKYITIPSGIQSDSLRIIISDATSNYNIADTSGYFYSAILKITSPEENAHWLSGSSQVIKWQYGSGITTLDFEFSLDSGKVWHVLTSNVPASQDSLIWDIPESYYSDKAFIRCYETSNHSLVDTSGQFTIYLPKLVLVNPTGGEKYQSGSPLKISWSSQYISNLRIDFSSDNGQNWQTLVSSVMAEDSSWTWDIPTDISSNEAKIRLLAVNDTTIYVENSTVFSIGNIIVKKPVLNDILISNKIANISWEATSSVRFVNIYTQNGRIADSTLTLIASNINAVDSNYNWLVPSLSTKDAIIYITDAEAQNSINNTSEKFTIGILNLTYPNGGEFLQSGYDVKIKWEVSPEILPLLNIDYSSDKGVNWNRIATGVRASDSSYTWSIPSGIYSDSTLIKIADYSNLSLADTSDNYFSLGGIELTVFNSREKVLTGTNKIITWSETQNVDNVDLFYKTLDNVWKPIVSNYPANAGSYVWQIPDEPSDTCYIMIRSTENTTLTDTNNAPFAISKIKLATFNGGNYYQTGRNYEINWDASSVSFVNIEYTSDSLNWEKITPNPIPADSGHYTWSIPDNENLASSNYQLRIYDVEYPNISDTSDSKFTVSYIKMKRPNGGEGQQLGTAYDVEWGVSATTVNYVNLYVELDAGSEIWTPIANNINASDLTYHWLIQTDPTPAARMKVEDAEHHEIYDVSDSSFTIASINLVQPNGGTNQKLQSGKTYTIKWNSTFVNNVTLEYSVDGGLNWNFITSISGDSTSYVWNVPEFPTSNAKIRIKDFDYSNIYDESDTTFAIASLRVTRPNDFMPFNINTQETISWESAQVDSIRIQLSTDGGSTFPINIGTANAVNGEYSWIVPDIPTANAKIRLIDADAINITDESDTTFLIGAYPSLEAVATKQSKTLKFIYNIPTAGEVVELSNFEFSINNSAYINGNSYILGDYTNLVGPTTDTLYWNSSGQLNNYEGYASFRVKFNSHYGVTYTLTVDSIFVDNMAPRFDINKFTLEQQAFSLGWDKALAQWEAAVDSSLPINYEIFVSETSSFDSIPDFSSYGLQVLMDELKTSTTYQIKVRPTDSFGNYSDYLLSFKTYAAADFNNDGKIDGADVSSYVFAWSNADSSAGADLSPYLGDIPIIQVVPDNKLELNDLVVFQKMWNYYAEFRGLPKENLFDAESKTIEFRKGENKFTFPIDSDAEELTALSVIIKYNPNVFDIDSVDIKTEQNTTDNLILSYADSAKGFVVIDFANLSGKIVGEQSLESVINCDFDVLKHADSLTVSYIGYDKQFKPAFNKNVVYTLQEVPNKFTLYQNYPNPFNPQTTILYDVPVKSKVTLKVYDILGREIATLVNKVQKPGSYKVTFGVNNLGKTLSSGVYFYRIVAGKFVKTKKMIILK